MCASFVLSLSKHEREIPRDRSPFDKLRVNGLVAAMALFSLAGCSGMHTPTVKEALTRPLGTAPPFTLGTRKAKVLAAWGNPDYVVAHGSDELGNVREEWIYHGRVQSLPIDYEYLSRNKRLFFEGENLTRCTTDEKDSR